MKRLNLNEGEIARKLRGGPRPVPPADLASAVIKEIPENLGRKSGRNVAWWAVAAFVVLGIAAALWGGLALQLDPPERAEHSVRATEEDENGTREVAAGDALFAEAEPGVTALVEPAPETSEPPPATGTLLVEVRDTTGAVLPGVTITVAGSTPAARERAEVTNLAGNARLAYLEPGEFTVRAEMPGFASLSWEGVRVTPGEERDLRLAMSVASVSETVAVVGESPIVNVHSTVVSSGYTDSFMPTTGGSREPNDAVYDRMYYEHYGVHPFVDTEDDPLSTFALDVDSASYTLARRVLADGYLPDADAVRVEEFLNFFDYGDAAPTDKDFAIHFEAAPSPFAKTARTWLLRVGLSARTVDPEARRPAVLTFLVDVSGSMARGYRLDQVKHGLHLLLDGLRDDDRVGLVVFGAGARVVHEPTRGREALRRSIDSLRPEGSTNLEDGLVRAYEVADTAFTTGATNRVILCSDGVANDGATGWRALLERVSERAERGIELTTLGFGIGNYNDVLMEQLADHGDGRYAYIDTNQEVRRIFGHQLTSMLETVATDAKLQVAFEPSVIQSYRLLGYENRDVADEDFRDDDVDAGEIGAGHQVTALYEVKLRDRAPERGGWATVTIRYGEAVEGEVVELEQTMASSALSSSWDAASGALKLAGIVAEFADILRGSYWARETSLEDVFVEAQRVQQAFPGRTEVAELAALIGRAKEIRAQEKEP